MAEHWIAEAGAELPADAFVFSPFLEGTTPFRPDNVTSFFIRVRNEVGAHTFDCMISVTSLPPSSLVRASMYGRLPDGLATPIPPSPFGSTSHALEERDRAAAEIMGAILGTAKSYEHEPASRDMIRRAR